LANSAQKRNRIPEKSFCLPFRSKNREASMMLDEDVVLFWVAEVLEDLNEKSAY
jgi:hypothetical protein